MTASISETTRYPHITRREGFAGGKPVIAGTRIKVSHVVIEYEMMGWTPDEIVNAHPHLTLAQVHAALAYYYDHTEEIHREIRESEAYVTQMEEREGRAARGEEERAASDRYG